MLRTITIIASVAAMLAVLLFATTAHALPGMNPGGKVVVTSPEARLMLGERTVATATRGMELPVLKVYGNWIGTRVDVGGTTVGGWILNREVAPAGNALALRPGTRRFSYEPADEVMPAPRMERFTPRREARTPTYFLPKTDPNRFH